MCGIAGTINFKNISLQAIKDSLIHRGPDEQTDLEYKNISLIHTRLSIQDISNGHQPFVYKNYVIIFNGEIYNHIAIRKEFLSEYNFLTISDTETILYLYIKYKEAMFDMLDGMFAFAILDKNTNKLIMARDRAGKKPLYLYKNNHKIMFASELNALKVIVPNLEANDDEIYSFLRNGFFAPTKTPYKNVFELKAGYFYEVDTDTLDIKEKKYFEILQFYKKPLDLDFESTLKELDQVLHKSVKDRLLSSDLEVGAFLSGGIDSSLIVGVASQYVNNLKTFTVKFDDTYDESALAKLTADKYQTHHTELRLSMNLKNDIENILYNYGEPFMDSSSIPSYYVSREAKKYVSVILNGDGADELFGGYRRYVPIARNWIDYVGYLSFLDKILPVAHNKQSMYNYLYRLLKISKKSSLDFYNSATNDIFEDSYVFQNTSTFNELKQFIDGVNQEPISELSKILYIDYSLILQNDLLKKMDIATMANSLEGRSPFLSKYMLELSPRIQDQYKVNKTTTKYILRELAKKYIPQTLINQPKRGFEVPLKKWVENDLKENIFDTLSSNTYSEKFIDRKYINKVLHRDLNISDEKRAKMLWTMYCLENWNKNNYKTTEDRKVKVAVVPKKLNILYLTTGLGLGGAERVILDLCKNIDKRYFNSRVIGLSSQDTMIESFKKHSLETKVLNSKKSVFDFIKSILFISRYIKCYQIDAIHAHMFHTLLIATALKILHPSLSIVFTPHNNYSGSKVRQMIVWLLRPFRTIDTIFTSSMKRFFHKKSFTIIPNGVDIKGYSTSNVNGKFTFVIVGRLEYMKNHSFLIDIVSELVDYDFELLVVGGGRLEKNLIQKVQNYNVEDKIKFLGPRKDINKILSSSHCLLLPSLWEAFPIVLLEAGASSLPVITTPVGSIPSFINEDNGYVVELSRFKQTMIEVMEDYPNAKEKGLRLYETIKNEYDIKNIVSKYEKLYRSLEN